MYVKKTGSHPSKLPNLTDEEVLQLEKKLSELSDSWGWFIFERAENNLEQVVKESSWMKEKPPGIRKLATTMKQGAKKFDESLQNHRKKKTSLPNA